MSEEMFSEGSGSLWEYAESYSSRPDTVLQNIERQAHLCTPMPQMLAGAQQGLLLEFFSRMIRPRRILEIGTFTGYSAICLARGLAPDGILHTIEVNGELEEMIRTNIHSAGMDGNINLHIGNALQIIPGMEEVFDLVFIDADKENYTNYYELILPKVKQGGWIIADNVLWYGKVLLPTERMDDETKSISVFNHYVLSDQRVHNLMLPFRDGLMIIRKV